MVRPFDIRDVSVIQRLSPHGRALAYEPVAIDGVSPLREAVRLTVSPRREGPVIMVCRPGNDHAGPEAFGVMHMSDLGDQLAGVLMYAAPAARGEALQGAWIELIDALCAEAAARDARLVMAEAAEGSSEAAALEACGFAAVLHQDVLKAVGNREPPRPPQREGSAVAGLREQTERDDLHVRILAQRVVPRLTAGLLGATDPARVMHRADCAYVLMHAQEAAGHISLQRGRRATAMRVLFRHDLPEIQPLIGPALSFALGDLCGKPGGPVYCMLPSYLSWLLPVLDGLGFAHVADNVLMVKHVVATVRQPVWSDKLAPVLGRLAKSDITHPNAGNKNHG